MWLLLQICPLHFQPHLRFVTVLIILGSVMLIVVMFGDYGACGEKICALQVFSTLVSILAIAEFVVGVLAWSQRQEIGLSIAEFYTSLYALYVKGGGDPAIGVTLMFIQGALHCCGITGMSVIEVAQKTCPEPDGFFEHIKMDSCPVVIATIFDSKATLVMWLFIGTGVLLIIAVICSVTLTKKICMTVSSPQYIILTQSTPALANPQPPQHQLISTYPNPDQDPVVFPPLSLVTVPAAQT
ncbi:23 kDa integral membrane protein isoform X2 [Mastacembelus armatus]|uniref:23 kDa integral membrane protein isoform X2 n=1 Tax=Mastacembelus armatus TaxID=205130 RepID=UPI000E46385D|nr:23 kDa integral membrane protein-like isoform X2 [Mastacembelus armatus]